jgi:acetyl-CoA carboxylase alpha subunit
MMRSLCSLWGFFNRKADTSHEILRLLNQIQELKAINDYQAFELEQKVAKLEEENRLLKSKIVARSKKRADKLKAKRERGTIKVITHDKSM